MTARLYYTSTTVGSEPIVIPDADKLAILLAVRDALSPETWRAFEYQETRWHHLSSATSQPIHHAIAALAPHLSELDRLLLFVDFRKYWCAQPDFGSRPLAPF